MASTYTKKESKFVWIRYKDASGKWKGKATGYLKDNYGDRRQAILLARSFSRKEQERSPNGKGEHWRAWVPSWLIARFGDTEGAGPGVGTARAYFNRWRLLDKWLEKTGIRAPAQFEYRHVLEYRDFRTTGRKAVSINTCIHELKFLSQAMNEAIKRGFATSNPCLRMGFKRVPRKEKAPWTDAEIQKVAAAVVTQPEWMRATFLLGLYQAARLRQCEVPLRDIDVPTRRITYWRSVSGRPLAKGDKPFTQPIDERALPELERLIAEQRAGGSEALCEIPAIPSVLWRRFLDGLGLKHLCHHGLRVTWCTRAASSETVSQAQAKRFVNHGSTGVHESYQRLSASDIARVPYGLALPETNPTRQP
jgi:integrase